MARVKLGRNDKCACGSGRKYKHCCLPRHQVNRPPDASGLRRPVSLRDAVKKVQAAAQQGKQLLAELGVFVFFADSGGAWLFEATQKDAVCLAEAGKPLAVSIKENSRTIEVDWSHRISVRDGQLALTGYEGQTEVLFDEAVSERVLDVMKRILNKCSPEFLRSLHLDKDSGGA